MNPILAAYNLGKMAAAYILPPKKKKKKKKNVKVVTNDREMIKVNNKR